MTVNKVLRLAGAVVGLALVSWFAVDGLKGTARGAIIWNGAVNIAGSTDVSTIGSSTYACDWNSTWGTATVNGVAFAGAAGSVTNMVSIANYTDYPGNNNPMSNGNAINLPSAYQSVLGGVAYGTPNNISVSLQSLISGHDYLVEVWSNDSRNGHPGGYVTWSSPGGNSVTLTYYNATTKVGQYALGTFTASGTSQAFSASAWTGDNYLNALQVRDLTGVGFWNGAGGVNTSTSAANFALNGPADSQNSGSFGQVPAIRNAVWFGDYYYASGSTTAVAQSNVTVAAGGISTGNVYFQNNTVPYTLTSSDSAGITGATPVTLQGTGLVTFAGANSYSGLTTIGGGTLQVAQAARAARWARETW